MNNFMKVVPAFWTWAKIGKHINISYRTSVTKDSIVAAKAVYKRRKVQNGLPACQVDV